MSVDLRKSDCPSCERAATVYDAPPSRVHHSNAVEVDPVALTNSLSAAREVELSLRDYSESLAIYTARPTVNSRALVAMARAQLALAVAELPSSV